MVVLGAAGRHMDHGSAVRGKRAMKPAPRWSHAVDARAARSLVGLAFLSGIVADLLFDRSLLGVSVPIAVAGLLAVLTWLGLRRGRPDVADLWLPFVAMASAAIVAVRTDGAIVGLNLGLAAAAVGAWAWAASGVPVTRRALAAVVELGLWATMSLITGAIAIVSHAASDASATRTFDRLGRAAPVLRGLLLAVPVVVVFAALLSSADAVFARLVSTVLTSPIDPAEPVRRAGFVVAAAWLVGGPLAIVTGLLAPPVPATAPGAAASAAGGPVNPAAAPASDGRPDPGPWAGASSAASPGSSPGSSRASTEAVIVLGAVDLLFAVFVVLQVAYLFGGGDTLAATGQPYSTYARQGYFELVAVVGLAGGLLMVGSVLAERSLAFVISAAVLLGLTGLILVSAAVRLSLYLQAYGWTELRFYVASSIAWLAVAGLLATVLLLRDRMRWLVHGLAMAAIAITLGVSVLGPQAFVTDQNVARVLDPTLVPPDGYPGLDSEYLLSLDDDAIPTLVAALDALGPADRLEVLAALTARRDELVAEAAEGGIASWNLARERAREALATLPDR
jgi:hypothetical protein